MYHFLQVNGVVTIGSVDITEANGKTFVNLSVAQTDSWKDKETGERKEKTNWFRLNITNQGIASYAKDFKTGDDIQIINGALESRDYDDKDGNKRTAIEITIAGPGAFVSTALSKTDREILKANKAT